MQLDRKDLKVISVLEYGRRVIEVFYLLDFQWLIKGPVSTLTGRPIDP